MCLDRKYDALCLRRVFLSYVKRLAPANDLVKKNVERPLRGKCALRNWSETQRRLYEAAMHLICKSACTLFDMVSFKETFKVWRGALHSVSLAYVRICSHLAFNYFFYSDCMHLCL